MLGFQRIGRNGDICFDRIQIQYRPSGVAKNYICALLQQRFRIGFNKAARFVERMEEEGILPPASRANKARTVRMD